MTFMILYYFVSIYTNIIIMFTRICYIILFMKFFFADIVVYNNA